MTRVIRTAVLGAVLVFGMAGAASADQAFTMTGYTNDITNGQWSLGFAFSPNTNVVVNELAIFDDGQNNGSVHAVGIFDSSGNLLASTNITQGTGYSNFFDWAKISNLALSAGQTYYIAEETGTSNYTWNVNGFSMNSKINYLYDAFTLSSTLVAPFGGCCTTTEGYFGPNFGIVSAPEPASLTL